MREIEGAQFIPYNYNLKGVQTRILKVENYNSKKKKIGSIGHLPELYVIIKVSSTPPWTCPLHPNITNIKPLTPMFDPPPHQPLLLLYPIIQRGRKLDLKSLLH